MAGGVSEPLLGAAGGGGGVRPPFQWGAEAAASWALAWPILVSSMARFVMATTDVAVVGHLPDDAAHGWTAKDFLAASAMANMVQGVFCSPPCAVSFAVNPLVAQALGASNRPLAGAWFLMAMALSVVANLPSIAAFFFVGDTLRVLGFSEAICHLAHVYSVYSWPWLIPNLWYQCMRFYFQALGLPRPALWNNLTFTAINLGLNIVFVFGVKPLGWGGLGFIGAPISLSVSRCMQPLTYALYMFVWRKAHRDAWPEPGSAVWTWPRFKEFSAQALPNVGTFLLQSLIGQVTTLMIAQLGDTAVAANSAVSNLTQVVSGGMGACVSQVTSIRVGYHLGNSNPLAAKNSSKIVLYAVVAVGLLLGILIPFRNEAVKLMTTNPDVDDLTARVLPGSVVGTVLSLVIIAGTQGVFPGQGRPSLTALLSFAFELPFSIGGTAAMVYWLRWDLVGLTWGSSALSAFEVVVVLAFWFFGSDWQKLSEESVRRSEAKAQDDDDVEEGEDSQDGDAPADDARA